MRKSIPGEWKDIFLTFLVFFPLFLISSCSDSIDKTFIVSIPVDQIPADIPAQSTDTTKVGVLRVHGGKIGSSTVDVYLSFNIRHYRESDLWIRLGENDSTYVFQESLNREPNNFLNDITYKYTFNGLVPNTKYFMWLFWEYGDITSTLRAEFTTLSE